MFLNKSRTNQVSAFTSDNWKQLANLKRIELQISRVQAHSYSGICARLYQPLRRIYGTNWNDVFNVTSHIVQNWAINTVFGTIRENGLVIAALIFAKATSLLTISTASLHCKKRWRLLLLLKQNIERLLQEEK